jgi:hypothetical protein
MAEVIYRSRKSLLSTVSSDLEKVEAQEAQLQTSQNKATYV